MAIRITRNEAGNCITFVGSSNPAYWNACLSAQINAEDSTRFDIINDVRTENDADTQYEFYAVAASDFADKDGNVFTTAQAAVDYVNANANVIGVSSTGTDLTGVDVNFRLDQTSTSSSWTTARPSCQHHQGCTQRRRYHPHPRYRRGRTLR